MANITDQETYAEFLTVLLSDISLPLDVCPVPWLSQEECLRQDISSVLQCTDLKRLREWHSIPRHVPLWDDIYTEVKNGQGAPALATLTGKDLNLCVDVLTTLEHARRLRGTAEVARKLFAQQELDMVHREIMGWKMS
jgi:hypothetical protein